MRAAPRVPTPFHRRLFVWLWVGALLGAQMLAAWHAIAHSQRLKGPKAQGASVAMSLTPAAQAQPFTWGHEDDGNWRCLALDHALAADGVVSDGTVSVAQGMDADVCVTAGYRAFRLDAHLYSARAPPQFLV